MPNHEGPPPGLPPDPSGPTQPIRPTQGGSEPIPERVRQPIVVPHQESTIAGLPRAFALAAVVALAVAVVVGFLLGRSFGGGDEEATDAAASRGRGGCSKALTISLQVVELQQQALANRTQAAQAVVIGDEAQVRELNSVLETLGPAIQEAQAKLEGAVAKCRSGGEGKGKGGKGKGDGGRQGNA